MISKITNQIIISAIRIFINNIYIDDGKFAIYFKNFLKKTHNVKLIYSPFYYTISE